MELKEATADSSDVAKDLFARINAVQGRLIAAQYELSLLKYSEADIQRQSSIIKTLREELKRRDETIGNLNAECANLQHRVAELVEIAKVLYMERPKSASKGNKKAH